MTADERRLLHHFLATLAYRTQKAVRAAPAGFSDFEAGNLVRTPKELVRPRTSVLGYARGAFRGGTYPRDRPEPLATLDAEVGRFRAMLDALFLRHDACRPARHAGPPSRGARASRELRAGSHGHRECQQGSGGPTGPRGGLDGGPHVMRALAAFIVVQGGATHSVRPWSF